MVNVRDHIPLEQGLRPFCCSAIALPCLAVRDHIPLEQGLRHAGREYPLLAPRRSETIFH